MIKLLVGVRPVKLTAVAGLVTLSKSNIVAMDNTVKIVLSLPNFMQNLLVVNFLVTTLGDVAAYTRSEDKTEVMSSPA